MGRYILRLDDMCEKRDIGKWDIMEKLLDMYAVKPLVGIIPHCEDPGLEKYPVDNDFWRRINTWTEKGWTIAMHGYNHVCGTNAGGINPVNKRSEFAGEPLEVQKEKIRNGVTIMREHGIDPRVFFAPSHTFDENTLKALIEESNIRFISDTPANKPYKIGKITFVPQQSGTVRDLPFDTVTFCYHPNIMKDTDFEKLERFFKIHEFSEFPLENADRKISLYDRLLMKLYYMKHK